MNKLIKIDYFPKFIGRITSFHLVSDLEFQNIKNIINEEHFFIENFFRLSKNLYEHVSKENIYVEEVIDNKEIEIISNFLDSFSNNFDLLEMILSNYNTDSDSIYSISDEELIDTVNIIKIFESNLKDDSHKIKQIIDENPHLLEDETVTECFSNIKDI